MNVNNHDYDTDYNRLIQSDNYKSLKVKNNHIVKKTTFDKFVEFFSSKRKVKRENQLKSKIVSILKDIKINDEDSITKTKNVLEKINTLKDSHFIFDLKNKSDILTKEVENKLSPSLEEIRLMKQQAKDPQERESFKQAIRVEKVRLGLSLGVALEKNTGATGTVIARNLKGKKIAVFKPTHQHAPFFIKLKNFFKRSYGGQLFYLSQKTDAQSKAEVAAYRLDKHFGFKMSPETTYETIDGKEGAFQRFLKGGVGDDGKEYGYKMFFDVIKDGSNFTVEGDNLVNFQKMAIFDYLIGNLDRHEENWFVREIKLPGDNDPIDIKVIDNANAFLTKNPELGSVRNQYKWKELDPAKKPLKKEIRDFILNELTEEKLEMFINNLKNDPTFSDFLDSNMENNLKQRLNVLINIAENYPDKSLEDLGNIVSDSEIKKYQKDRLD